MVRIIPALFLSLCFATYTFGFSKIKEIPVPQGYARINYDSGSFSAYLQHLPLKSENAILKWNGEKVIGLLYNVYAVVNKPLLFKADLEQCADFCMRFWGDYHQSRNKLNDLYLFDYNGRKKYFKDSQKGYRNYVKWHMAYSNSHSLKKGAMAITGSILQPGDMFVQNTDGGIGHVSMIVDAAQNQDGQMVYLIGYGFIPAQEFHIEKARKGYGMDGWFTREGYEKYLSEFPFGSYGAPVLRRFE